VEEGDTGAKLRIMKEENQRLRLENGDLRG
jgi:regulator of replication initiation timing